jgi:hypothetical protein
MCGLAHDRRPYGGEAGSLHGQGKGIAALVTTAWGWALASLAASVLPAFAIYWYHPFYSTPGIKMTPLQEFLPLIGAGFLWLILTVVVVVKAVQTGRRMGVSEHDQGELLKADACLTLLSGVVSLGGRQAGGAAVTTFIGFCLLVFSLLYLGIARGLGLRTPFRAWLYPIGIAAMTAAAWL